MRTGGWSVACCYSPNAYSRLHRVGGSLGHTTVTFTCSEREIYSFGLIGYGDFLHSDNSSDKYKYTFWCPNVRNERYAESDRNYHMSQAKDMEMAARKCTSYMRPLYLHEFFHKSFNMITDQRKKAVQHFRQ